MDPYTASLLLGGLGLVAMAVSGLSRHASTHGHGRAVLHGRGHGHGHARAHLPAQTPLAPKAAALETLTQHALSFFSPRVLFSVLLGAGTAGVLLRPLLPGWLRFVAAVVAGLAFEWLFVRRVWEFALRFASKPAMTLETAVSDRATAVTSFDGNGHGIVRVDLDGQVVQILATLEPDQRGAKVRAGAELWIESIDVDRNRCTVSVR